MTFDNTGMFQCVVGYDGGPPIIPALHSQRPENERFKVAFSWIVSVWPAKVA